MTRAGRVDESHSGRGHDRLQDLKKRFGIVAD
jgi:hypothetical protein